ncbi:nucleotidyltransferase family protein [Paenibacillus sp. Soil522]|uniref:nucleotidyltransferase family protein n=1 Tax=Paenibacillus sp. Soil522 TaxID=1736388 RepID=UPI00138F1425|nr:NTP transferase domain-containing protein [Paenibacillus sp. Soil522]
MGVRKQSLELAKGKPLAIVGLHTLLSSPLKNVMAVVHPEDPLEWLSVEGGAAGHAAPSDVKAVRLVACPEASQGMSYSIRCGLKALMADEPALDAIVVALADQPFITSEMIAELIHYWSERPELDFVATAAHDAGGKSIVLMPPAVLSRSMFASVLLLEGDTGARKLFQSPDFKGCGLVAADRTTLLDIDTPADMELAKKHYSAYFI